MRSSIHANLTKKKTKCGMLVIQMILKMPKSYHSTHPEIVHIGGYQLKMDAENQDGDLRNSCAQ